MWVAPRAHAPVTLLSFASEFFAKRGCAFATLAYVTPALALAGEQVRVNLFKNVKRSGTIDKQGGGKDFAASKQTPKAPPKKKENRWEGLPSTDNYIK